MKTNSYILMAAIAMVAITAAPLLAGSPATADRASDLIGAQVTSQAGEFLGSVDDVIVGADAKASYLIVTKADQARFVALPVAATTPQLKSSGKVMVNISRERFDTMPSFTSSELAEMSSAKHDSARGYRNEQMDTEKNVVNGISTWNPYPF